MATTTFTYITYSAAETVDCGKKFSRILKENDVVLLEGALGGGKTTFAKGIISGFDCNERVLSPTFTLVRQYHVKGMQVHHLDLYRLSKKEAGNAEFKEYLYPQGAITLIEWGDRVEDMLDSYIKVEFYFVAEYERKLVFSFHPAHSVRCIALPGHARKRPTKRGPR